MRNPGNRIQVICVHTLEIHEKVYLYDLLVSLSLSNFPYHHLVQSAKIDISKNNDHWSSTKSKFSAIFLIKVLPLQTCLKTIKTVRLNKLPKQKKEWTSSRPAIGMVLFGRSFGCLSDNIDGSTADFIERTRRHFVNLQLLMWQHPLMHRLPTRAWRQFVDDSDALIAVGREQVRRASADGTTDSMIGRLAASDHYSHDDVVCTAVDMIIGSMETTVKTLLWTMYCMSRSAKARERLQEQLDAVVGDSELVTKQHAAKLDYPKAILKETMRLYPPGIGVQRYLQRDTEMCGYVVPKGVSYDEAKSVSST